MLAGVSALSPTFAHPTACARLLGLTDATARDLRVARGETCAEVAMLPPGRCGGAAAALHARPA